MITKSYPLAVPDDLLSHIKSVAKLTNLSQADVMRQAMIKGLPILMADLGTEYVRPFTKAEAKLAFGPDKEADAIANAMCSRGGSNPLPGE